MVGAALIPIATSDDSRQTVITKLKLFFSRMNLIDSNFEAFIDPFWYFFLIFVQPEADFICSIIMEYVDI